MKFLFLIFLFIPLSAFSLTEKEIIDSVMRNFPSIEEAALKAKSAEGELIAAEGAFDHKLTFKSRNRIEDVYDNQFFETSIERRTPYGGVSMIAGLRQGVGDFPPYAGKLRTSGAGEVFAGLSLPILRNFQTDEFRTNLLIKKLEVKRAEEETKIKRLVYVHKALSLFYKYAYVLQTLKVNKGIYELANARQDMFEKRYRAGDLEKIKVTDNLRTIDKRGSQILKGEIELSKLKAELSLYLRDENGEIKTINENIDSEAILRQPEEMTSLKGVESNPQLEVLKLQDKILKAQKFYYNQSQLPGLNVELLGAKELSPNDVKDDPQTVYVGVKFDFPIENRKAEGMDTAYFYKIKALEKQKLFIGQELEQKFRFFLDASRKSKELWEVTSREYVSTIKMAKAEKSKMDQGASDLFIVNLRELDVADVEIRRWGALYDYHQYLLDAKLFSATLIKQSDF